MKLVKSLNINSIIRILNEKLVIRMFDTARARFLIIEYPVNVIGEMTVAEFAINNDWLLQKLEKVEGETVQCIVTEDHLKFGQTVEIDGLKVHQDHEVAFLDKHSAPIRDISPEIDPQINEDDVVVKVKIPSVRALIKCLDSIGTNAFVISATKELLVFNTENDPSGTGSGLIIEVAPYKLTSEDNRNTYKVSEVLNFAKSIIGIKEVDISYVKNDPMIIEAVGENSRFKLFAMPFDE